MLENKPSRAFSCMTSSGSKVKSTMSESPDSNSPSVKVYLTSVSLGPPEKVIAVNSISVAVTVSSNVSDTLFSSSTTEKLTRLGATSSLYTWATLAAMLLSPSITSSTGLSLASRRNESGYRIQHRPPKIQMALSLFKMLRSSLLICRVTSVLCSSFTLRISPDCTGRTFPVFSKVDCNLTSVKFTYCKSMTSL